MNPMTNMNAPSAAPLSIAQPTNRQPPEPTSTVDPLKVLAWVDDDRLLIKDRTKHGLHRRVIARKGGAPNAEWVRAVSIYDNVELERITHWYVQQGEFCFLWIFWKEKS